ncbi:hypothetical protein [Providencia stuartii]|uniref:hypothetical protein n=1 Tax=Providencia stuartii TaxID=588 RepID=UPI001122D798|nr:hypothetical protein [Providencia stuartii]
MKERGIIFNSEMVRAILDGRKTQTRRVMKVQPVLNGNWWEAYGAAWGKENKSVPVVPCHSLANNCPYGQVGDRLWVRETWQGPLVDSEKAYDLFKDPAPYQKVENCVYKADGGHAPEYIDFDDNFRQGWRPSIHMPRWASRITLEITDVRVERLQAATDDDFKAEGYPLKRDLTGGSTDTFCWFRHLWDSISKPDCNFESNPWVWVIEFKRV